MKLFVTGGAGFLGSHVVDLLVERGHEVVVFDNLTTGRGKWVNPKAMLICGEMMNLYQYVESLRGCVAAFHFQANADVRGGTENRTVDFKQNLCCTSLLLEACKWANVKTFVFASSAAVYGEPKVFPTPERYSPERQTSLYGATKLGCEKLIEAYSTYYGIRPLIFRFVSLIGERYHHGCIKDFYDKLKRDPKRMEILGDGSQRKSFLYVKDAARAIVEAYENKEANGIYNLGHYDMVDVKYVAKAVATLMNLDPEFTFGNEKRGWVGDSPTVHLECERIREAIGWVPETSINEGIKRTVEFLSHEQAR